MGTFTQTDELASAVLSIESARSCTAYVSDPFFSSADLSMELTNGAEQSSFEVVRPADVSVEDTMRFVSEHYESLMQRLAD